MKNGQSDIKRANQEIALKIRFRRATIKLSQNEAAWFAGMALKRFQAIEEGACMPSVNELMELAKVLRTSVVWLLGLSGDGAKQIMDWEKNSNSNDPSVHVDAIHSIVQAALPHTSGLHPMCKTPDIVAVRNECDKLLDKMDFEQLRESLQLLMEVKKHDG